MTSKRMILVVEDNWINREILTEILSDSYTVLEAENGQDALALLRKRGDDIALILLDIQMPVMDGYSFLDQIRGDENLSLIPVIVMTQSNREQDEVEALAHGATDFVPKPYRPQVILHRVASIIKLRENAALANQFKHDQLTGLSSREYFYQQVRDRLREDPLGEYTIICSNIENFKVYNDIFGIKAGNQLLKELASDILADVGTDGICGRFGADRFLILMQRQTERKKRSKLIQMYRRHYTVRKKLMLKWGIYDIVDRSVPVEQMCDRAFLAADRIRGQYNQHATMYDEALRNRLLRDQAITESMENALREEQFTVYLQPKFSLRNDSLAGAEALVRWVHPQLGFLSPGEFIPLFEKNGFITRLDRYIWEKVCAQLQVWREKGFPVIPVSVNVSRADIYQEDLPETLSALVNKYGVEPPLLHLELTESAYTENPNQIIATVERLRKLGFIVEMDDFGSGYSSLNMLNQMKLDVLKLDMKFIQSETTKPVEHGILQFIITLARWLNMSVVAEGVETRAQLERLQELGCDYVQGYFFAKPMPMEAFEKLIQDNLTEKMEQPEDRQESPERKSLLVVDDDALYRAKVRETFQSQYQVLEAEDADRAIAHIRKHGHSSVVAVLLSMSLPDKGAERFLEQLRRDPMLWRIPVVSTLPGGQVTEEKIVHLDTDDFLCKCHPMSDLRHRINRLLSMATQRERERMLQDAASRDYLTGLLNRRGLFTAFEALRQEDMPLALCLFDVDDLKVVNDSNGHKAGDDILQSFSDLLRRNTRAGDILCRYGGDEFVVLLRHISSPEVILRKCESICQDFSSTVLADGTHVACSAGIALCSAEERPSAELIERADAALYRAKKMHKGGCCLCEA